MVGVCPRRLLEGCAHQKGAELGGPGVGRRYHSDGLLLSWVPGRSVRWSVCPAAPSPRLAPERAERAGQGRRPGPHSEGRRGDWGRGSGRRGAGETGGDRGRSGRVEAEARAARTGHLRGAAAGAGRGGRRARPGRRDSRVGPGGATAAPAQPAAARDENQAPRSGPRAAPAAKSSAGRPPPAPPPAAPTVQTRRARPRHRRLRPGVESLPPPLPTCGILKPQFLRL